MPDKNDETPTKDDDKSKVNDPEDKDKDKPKAKGDGDGDGEKMVPQSQVDKIVEGRLARERAQSAEREEAAATKAKKDAEDARLLEDKKFEELAARKAQEADEAKAALAEYERKEKVDALLNKREITDPAERALFTAIKFDGLEGLDEHIKAYRAMVEKRVEAGVLKQLGGDPPPKRPDAKPKEGDLASQLTAAEAKASASGSSDDWDAYLRLANKQSDAIAERSKLRP